ncbi:MAG: hypothetical protein K2L48_04505 [Mycoplasmoidaceae bacterium]|nr:hypothetical protein [Mycoplasmoidaceae bacterium]
MKIKKRILSSSLVLNIFSISFIGFLQATTTTANVTKVLDYNLIQNDDLETYGTG